MAALPHVFGMTEVNFSACVAISILMDAIMGEMKGGSRFSVHCSATTEGGGKRNYLCL
jgi:hypothetical protein